MAIKTIDALIPMEEDEQRTLAQWLSLRDITWFHVPNQHWHPQTIRDGDPLAPGREGGHAGHYGRLAAGSTSRRAKRRSWSNGV